MKTDLGRKLVGFSLLSFFLTGLVFLSIGVDNCSKAQALESSSDKSGLTTTNSTQTSQVTEVKDNENITVNLYLFYGEGCPHCDKEEQFLQALKEEYQDLVKIETYEIYYSPANARLLKTIANELDLSVGGVPILFVEDFSIIGFGSANTTGQHIRQAIENCLAGVECGNIVSKTIAEAEVAKREVSQREIGYDSPSVVESEEGGGILQDQDLNIKLPLIGKEVDLRTLSLPVLTLLLGALDGFNPCAMWILVFLISMLINLEDRRRLFILGFTFIFVSGLVYFAFLAAWFNLFQFVGFVHWVRFTVGLVAIASGIIHLKHYHEKETGCKVTNSQQRSRIMKRIKKVIGRQNLLLALIGISVLAVSVNLIELVCSAGLPAIYTNILSLSKLSAVQYYGYLALYALVFMIDDLLVFTIAIKTFQVTGITSKYTKYSNLIGGIVILILGILLLFKPQALMFG